MTLDAEITVFHVCTYSSVEHTEAAKLVGLVIQK
jgi:hypothetical protein